MKRGLSPLVVTLLLILVGVAASLIIYMWLTGFASSAVQVPSEMKVNIRLETAELHADDDVAYIYGRNVGSTTIDLTALKDVAVYIYDHYNGTLVYAKTFNPADSSPPNITTSEHDKLIEPGEWFNITLNDVTTIEEGKYYDIKVVIGGVEAWLVSVKAEK